MAWQMIKRLLGNAMPWLLAALLGFAVYQYMQAARYEAERDSARVEHQNAEARAVALGRALDWQRDQIAHLNDVLDRRDAQIDSIVADIRASRDALTTLERDDAATRDWSAEPLPVGITDWVRQLTDDAGTDRAGADSAGAPDYNIAVAGHR